MRHGHTHRQNLQKDGTENGREGGKSSMMSGVGAQAMEVELPFAEMGRAAREAGRALYLEHVRLRC